MYLKYQLVRDRDCFQRQVSSDNRISLEILVLDKLASPADPHHATHTLTMAVTVARFTLCRRPVQCGHGANVKCSCLDIVLCPAVQSTQQHCAAQAH